MRALRHPQCRRNVPRSAFPCMLIAQALRISIAQVVESLSALYRSWARIFQCLCVTRHGAAFEATCLSTGRRHAGPWTLDLHDGNADALKDEQGLFDTGGQGKDLVPQTNEDGGVLPDLSISWCSRP